MIPAFYYKATYIVVALVLLSSSIVVPKANAEEVSGCKWENGVYICDSKGQLSQGYYPFVGGGSCCNCNTKHYGTLPSGFPTQDIDTVTFFLTTSRSNSYYTSIVVGETNLKLTFTNPDATKTYSSTATSKEVAVTGVQLPIDVPWYVVFEFDLTIEDVGPNWKWEIGDGDGQWNSAAWLHMSDIGTDGLPGEAQTYGCGYAETRPGWYSVLFGNVEEGTIPAPTPSASPSLSPSPTQTPGEEGPPSITATRTVTKVAGSNTYDVTLKIVNNGDVEVTWLRFADQLIDLQYVSAPGEESGFAVLEYKTLDDTQNDYEIWIYSDLVDGLAPGKEATFKYQVVPIIDSDTYRTQMWVEFPMWEGYITIYTWDTLSINTPINPHSALR